MPQQTAIEKLMQTIEYWNISIDCKNLFQQICIQALEIEKKQIENAYNAGYNAAVYEIDFENSEVYFNKTFKKINNE
jgi:hypothetical protein